MLQFEGCDVSDARKSKLIAIVVGGVTVMQTEKVYDMKQTNGEGIG